ncbi:hypothetical protein BKP35_16460 [Anaerobacillus arseniciselenatis]|uniref:Uncharacterized protein n=1 Tax=Anaerobacillus arseniciselenatis TaxID=85682 RepID=A0A1S2LAT0_9BACI|nr:hypothetical protein [Anaerobacillus arseniciselenatis]OIJ09446.1 hypothetical protein BKP35_16460 [Anaerobacillus arseniciselenatis]
MSNEIKILPNESDLLIRIQEELKYDNLFNLIMERDQLKKELYHPDFINALEQDLHRWYSVAEAGRVIGGEKRIPPSSITYYIDNLKEYIIPDDAPSNKYIRLNYLSLIKIKMVFLLKDEFRLNGLRAEVGITGKPTTVPNNTPSNYGDINLEQMKEKLEKFEAMNEVLWGLLVEKGEDGNPSLKKPLKSLLTSETLLLEDQSSISQKIEEQSEVIEKLVYENNELKERVGKTEIHSYSLVEKFEEDQSSISQKLKEQSKAIEELVHENNELKEIIGKAEEHSSSLVENLEDKEKERERILESEKKINSLTEMIRARQQAEEEWENQGLIKKLTGNKSEFIDKRIESLLKKTNKDN